MITNETSYITSTCTYNLNNINQFILVLKNKYYAAFKYWEKIICYSKMLY